LLAHSDDVSSGVKVAETELNSRELERKFFKLRKSRLTELALGSIGVEHDEAHSRLFDAQNRAFFTRVYSEVVLFEIE
jgi:hypothetical protein